MLKIAPRSLVAWIDALADQEIPVLAETAQEIVVLAAQPDLVSATQLADVILRDPLMTVRVFATLARLRGSRPGTEVTHVEGCIVMMGMPRFLASCENLPTIEEHLKGHDEALEGLMRVVRRARTAARLSWNFAVWRKDPDTEELAIAALLHDIAEILVWVYAPELALATRAEQRADPLHRSAQAQLKVLHLELVELQQALGRRWHLPALLIDMMGRKVEDDRRAKNVGIAVNIARHSAGGWDSPALVHDYAEAAQLLVASPQRVREMVEGSEHDAAEVNDDPGPREEPSAKDALAQA
jgi:HD-like signal output (HDOD) protein